MPAWVVDLLNRLNSTFVVDGRWQWFVSGLGYTLLISLFSVLLGLVIGILMALMRLSKSKILRAVSGIYTRYADNGAAAYNLFCYFCKCAY